MGPIAPFDSLGYFTMMLMFDFSFWERILSQKPEKKKSHRGVLEFLFLIITGVIILEKACFHFLHRSAWLGLRFLVWLGSWVDFGVVDNRFLVHIH